MDPGWRARQLAGPGTKRRRWSHCIAIALLAAWPGQAFGYRPFDGTDASVALPGEFELEYGPLGYVKLGQQHSFAGPGLIANLGLFERWELVLQGRQLTGLDRAIERPHAQLLDTGLFLKGVLREGRLQSHRGASIAAEFGPLLPTVNDNANLGATAALIVSERWKLITIHVNTAATLTRARRADLFGGAIVEGCYGWPIRPVIELFIEREFGASRVYSALAGVIWRAKKDLAFDAALRSYRNNDDNAYEVRAGFTWATAMWGDQ